MFAAEFKQEMLRQFLDRRAQVVSHAQIAREFDLSVQMLQLWARDVARQPEPEASEVFPGLPSVQEELRRLQREVQRLQQVNSFSNAAAAYFAKAPR